LIEVQHLTKRYGNHTAVSDLSFTVENGTIYGFLGPNGAGKSTTMNILTGCLAATSGTVKIDGLDIFEDAEQAKRKIGYLPELPPLYVDMTPAEYLDFVAKAKGLKEKQVRQEQLAQVMELTQITDVKDRLIRNLSKGYRQRVGIAQAILGAPEIIILDEPTVGLDPIQIIEIRELIKSLGKEHTVILSSHILSEVQAVCDQVLIIAKGALVACDTPENLEKLFGGSQSYVLTVRAEEADVKQALDALPQVTNFTYEAKEDGTALVTVQAEGEEDLSEQLFFAFGDIRKPILNMNRSQASLEEVFLELTGHKGEAQESSAPAEEASKAEAAAPEEEKEEK